MSESPLVSVVVIAYNSASTIVETLDSILCQSYGNIELVVTDDGSSDDTVAYVRGWAQDNGSRFSNVEIVTSEENTGISANCNRGVASSAGEWIKIIAADDVLEGQAIERYLKFFEGREHGVVFSRMRVFGGALTDEKKNFFDTAYKILRSNYTAEQQNDIIRYSMNFCPAPAAFMPAKLIYGAGMFDESVALAEDMPMWLRLTNRGVRLEFIDEELVGYRLENGSVQKSGRFDVTKRLLKYKYLLGIKRSCLYKHISQLKNTDSFVNKLCFSLLKLRSIGGIRKFRRKAALMPALYGLPPRVITYK